MPHLRDFAHLCIRDTDYAGLRAVSRTVWDWKDFRSFPTLHRHNYLLQSWHSREGTFFPQSNNWIILWRFQQITSREQSLLQSTEALRPLTSLLHDGSARGKPSWMQETCNYTNAILFPASLGMISPGQPSALLLWSSQALVLITWIQPPLAWWNGFPNWADLDQRQEELTCRCLQVRLASKSIHKWQWHCNTNDHQSIFMLQVELHCWLFIK